MLFLRRGSARLCAAGWRRDAVAAAVVAHTGIGSRKPIGMAVVAVDRSFSTSPKDEDVRAKIAAKAKTRNVAFSDDQLKRTVDFFKSVGFSHVNALRVIDRTPDVRILQPREHRPTTYMIFGILMVTGGIVSRDNPVDGLQSRFDGQKGI